MDMSTFQTTIDTSVFLASKGKIELALQVVEEAIKILYLEKETDESLENEKYVFDELINKYNFDKNNFDSDRLYKRIRNITLNKNAFFIDVKGDLNKKYNKKNITK